MSAPIVTYADLADLPDEVRERVMARIRHADDEATRAQAALQAVANYLRLSANTSHKNAERHPYIDGRKAEAMGALSVLRHHGFGGEH